ncbi:MAG: hydrogenase formation protein HypD, partial [Clostridiales bacterium]|nr:hydrogenase formation protein HypD [Clostridiales bacterium]
EVAISLMQKVFEPSNATWRGLGVIDNSGLKINSDYFEFDASKYFEMQANSSSKPTVCICGEILTGKKKPINCTLFGNACTPYSPIGACMVSFEGNCASYYKYRLEVENV